MVSVFSVRPSFESESNVFFSSVFLFVVFSNWLADQLTDLNDSVRRTDERTN